MKSFDSSAIFMVDYETDTALVREYMSNADYNNLLQNEKSGMVKIMNHRIIGSADEKAA